MQLSRVFVGVLVYVCTWFEWFRSVLESGFGFGSGLRVGSDLGSHLFVVLFFGHLG